MVNHSARQQLYCRHLCPIYEWTIATQRSSSKETQETDQADPLLQPTSITPFVTMHPLRFCDPNSRPSTGPMAWARAKISELFFFLPSLNPPCEYLLTLANHLWFMSV